MTVANSLQDDVFQHITDQDRETTLSFITMSSRNLCSPDEALESICLSLALKYALTERPV